MKKYEISTNCRNIEDAFIKVEASNEKEAIEKAHQWGIKQYEKDYKRFSILDIQLIK